MTPEPTPPQPAPTTTRAGPAAAPSQGATVAPRRAELQKLNFADGATALSPRGAPAGRVDDGGMAMSWLIFLGATKAHDHTAALNAWRATRNALDSLPLAARVAEVRRYRESFLAASAVLSVDPTLPKDFWSGEIMDRVYETAPHVWLEVCGDKVSNWLISLPKVDKSAPVDAATLDRHAVIQTFAKRVAYAPGTRPGAVSQYRWEVEKDDSTGFACVYAWPTTDAGGLPQIVAFTGSDDWLDVLSDLSKPGVGAHQWSTARASVQRLCRLGVAAKKQGSRPLVLTGHSLGGALAQLAASAFAPDLALPISEVVTFNAPGVPASVVEAFKRAQQDSKRPIGVTHYSSNEDLVSRVGQAALPGKRVNVTSKSDQAGGDLLGAHTDPLIIGTPGAHGLNGKVTDPALHDVDRPLLEAARLGANELVSWLQGFGIAANAPTRFQDWSLKREIIVPLVRHIVLSPTGLDDVLRLVDNLVGRVATILMPLRGLKNTGFRLTLANALENGLDDLSDALTPTSETGWPKALALDKVRGMIEAYATRLRTVVRALRGASPRP